MVRKRPSPVITGGLIVLALALRVAAPLAAQLCPALVIAVIVLAILGPPDEVMAVLAGIGGVAVAFGLTLLLAALSVLRTVLRSAGRRR